jgi:hypothetical protein
VLLPLSAFGLLSFHFPLKRCSQFSK